MLKSTQKLFIALMYNHKMNYFSTMAIRDAINSAMADEMERDERVFLMGNLVVVGVGWGGGEGGRFDFKYLF